VIEDCTTLRVFEINAPPRRPISPLVTPSMISRGRPKGTPEAIEGSQRRDLGKVTISTITIDGYTDDLSIGIDRSSWSIVVQTYVQDHVRAEFGVCKPAAAPAH
jgi:hypothetical protein